MTTAMPPGFSCDPDLLRELGLDADTAAALGAYDQVTTRLGYSRARQPGRWQGLGWDVDFVCGSEIGNAIDQLLLRRLHDFVPTRPRPRIIDCGANIGLSVLHFRRQYPDARLTAFEPDPEFLPVLHRNLERNGAGEVEVIPAAVWTQSGTSDWWCEGVNGSKLVVPTASVGDAPRSADCREGGSIVQVLTVDLADYLDGEVDLLKLDIEGAEFEVVRHLGRRLRTVRNLTIECHLDAERGDALAAMLATLHREGFAIGVNLIGPWRDLLRQAPTPPNHWSQYLLIAAWRDAPPESAPFDSLTALAGQRYWRLVAENRWWQNRDAAWPAPPPARTIDASAGGPSAPECATPTAGTCTDSARSASTGGDPMAARSVASAAPSLSSGDDRGAEVARLAARCEALQRQWQAADEQCRREHAETQAALARSRQFESECERLRQQVSQVDRDLQAAMQERGRLLAELVASRREQAADRLRLTTAGEALRHWQQEADRWRQRAEAADREHRETLTGLRQAQQRLLALEGGAGGAASARPASAPSGPDQPPADPWSGALEELRERCRGLVRQLSALSARPGDPPPGTNG